eukprot:Protomagalhaensia_wolfi_Nauph_80__5844@NODE_741_length_2047_cov_4_950199_g555_i0_p1_GENE_NODE_741_length_2047_cov_4_950199_g555_i0NODE_741_length_2047_cov_4_950199_g555_i0_p1_ORF_typecomplete_len427_score45_20_NODE_741_length_2047_cov_4_950199_g555_i0371317
MLPIPVNPGIILLLLLLLIPSTTAATLPLYRLQPTEVSSVRHECRPSQCRGLPHFSIWASAIACLDAAPPGCTYYLNMSALGNYPVLNSSTKQHFYVQVLPDLKQHLPTVHSFTGDVIFNLTGGLTGCDFTAVASTHPDEPPALIVPLDPSKIQGNTVTIDLSQLIPPLRVRYFGISTTCSSLTVSSASTPHVMGSFEVVVGHQARLVSANRRVLQFLSFRPTTPECQLERDCSEGPMPFVEVQECAAKMPIGCQATGSYYVSGSTVDSGCTDTQGPDGGLRASLNAGLLRVFGETTNVTFEHLPVVHFFTKAAANCRFVTFSTAQRCPIDSVEPPRQQALRLLAGTTETTLPSSYVPLKDHIGLSFDGGPSVCGTAAWLEVNDAVVSFLYTRTPDPTTSSPQDSVLHYLALQSAAFLLLITLSIV